VVQASAGIFQMAKKAEMGLTASVADITLSTNLPEILD